VKLFSYLRLTGIPHVIQETDVLKAPKGKVVSVKHHRVCIGDSKLILRSWENAFDVADIQSKLDMVHSLFWSLINR
jgi:hypothetical protein